MIIGTRLEYCLTDILLKKIDIDEVYVIVADNNFNYNDLEAMSHWWNRQLDPMASHLSNGKNSLHLFDFEEVLLTIQNLGDDGKIAVRCSGELAPVIDILDKLKKRHWFVLNVCETDMEPAVRMAWDNYRILAGLCK